MASTAKTHKPLINNRLKKSYLYKCS